MNKKLMVLLVMLISICAIANVSAADSADNITSDDTLDIETYIGDVDDLSYDNDEKTINHDLADEDSLSSTPETYREIQYLIDNAQEGSIIDLEEKTYECDYLIIVNRTVNIDGHGATIKIKDSDNNMDLTPFFSVDASNVTLNNVKFIGGVFRFGGAITWNGDNGTLSNCEFKDNVANGNNESGIAGAVWLNGFNCNIINCSFINNEAYIHGGAVLCSGDNCSIINCDFKDNKAIGDDSKGGALTIYANNCTVENCNFTNNYCVDYGGAICVIDYTNKIVGCVFTGNYLTGTNSTGDYYRGGGAINSICIDLIIDSCKFISNNAGNYYGGALNLANNNTVKNSYFKGNSAKNKEGAGNDILVFENSTIISNFIQLPYNSNNMDYNKFIAYYSVYGIDPSVLDANNNFNRTKINSVVKFSAGMVFEYTRSGTIQVSVEGGRIDESNIKVLKNSKAKISFKNNVITVSGLAVGKYTLRVTTIPDENHNSVNGDLTITVKKATATIKASKITVALKKGTLWTIKLVDAKTGKAISKMKLTLKVYTGKKYKTVTVTTNSNGVASYKTSSLSKGTHKIVVSGSNAGYTFNTLTSSINVIKQKALKFKVKKDVSYDGSSLSITVKYKNKPINGIKIKLLVFTGKKYKTIVLKSKKKGKFKGVCGWGTNKMTVGTHKIVIMPSSIKYSGSKTVKLKLKKSAKKYPSWQSKV